MTHQAKFIIEPSDERGLMRVGDANFPIGVTLHVVSPNGIIREVKYTTALASLDYREAMEYIKENKFIDMGANGEGWLSYSERTVSQRYRTFMSVLTQRALECLKKHTEEQILRIINANENGVKEIGMLLPFDATLNGVGVHQEEIAKLLKQLMLDVTYECSFPSLEQLKKRTCDNPYICDLITLIEETFA